MTPPERPVNIALACATCGRQLAATLARLEENPEVPCPNCGAVTRFDAKALTQGVEGMARSVAKVKQQVKKLR